jgi:hypothetical protein
MLGMGMLGAYSNALSPWGLLDTASGGSEFTEEAVYDAVFPDRIEARVSGGPYVTLFGALQYTHVEQYSTADIISRDLGATLRIASSVPGPGVLYLNAIVLVCMARRRRSCQ